MNSSLEGRETYYQTCSSSDVGKARPHAENMAWFKDADSYETRRFGHDPGYSVPVKEVAGKPAFNAT